MNRVLYILTLTVSMPVLSQTGQLRVENVKVIRAGSNFDRLNKYEEDWNKLSIERLNETVDKLKASSFFLDSLSAEEQHDTIREIQDNAVLYAQNRSRFSMLEYENQAFKDSISVTKQAKAVCSYSDSTLTIHTGFGIFGGIYFTIELQNYQVNGSVNFDLYKEAVFKAHLNDSTLSHRIDVPIEKKILHIDHYPSSNGEHLNGKLTFHTATFYRSANLDPYLSKDYYDPTEVNEIYYLGELEFTCKVLDPLKRIEW